MRHFTLLIACCLLTLAAAGQDLYPMEGPGSNGKYGYVDKEGNTVIDCKYDEVWEFSEGLALVELNGKYGFIDKQGRTVIDFKYHNAGTVGEGLAPVELNGKWGFIDRQGNTVIDCKYDRAGSFSEGLAQVRLNGKYGYVDKEGNTVIDCKYDWAVSFSEGLAWVILNGKQGYIDTTGQWFDSEEEVLRSKFSLFAKKYVEQRVNEWQKKGEFEPTVQWQARVNEQTRTAKIAELTREAEKQFIAEQSENMNIAYTLGQYDADNQIYMIICNDQHLLVPVPLAEAPAFKAAWAQVKKAPKYFIENDRLAVAEMSFRTPAGKTYHYSNAASLNYTIAQVDYNFDPIEIELPSSAPAQKGRQTISTVNVAQQSSRPSSDVDIDIPVTNTPNKNTFVLIVANEDYAFVDDVQFALNDGRIFREYCIKTLGIPERQVWLYENASLGILSSGINKMVQAIRIFDNAHAIIYYCGHGIPDEKTGDAYIIPTDGNGTDVASCYSLNKLYKTMSAVRNARITYFMDACFTGANRDGSMLVAARGVAIKAKPEVIEGNTIVFSAASGDETAMAFQEKGHGLFTYFLLKKLQETKGNVSYGELAEYINDNVLRESFLINNKPQNPVVATSPQWSASWKNTSLK